MEIVRGTCDGTGAAINVCLGFIPDYVKVWNMEGSIESIEWIREMEIITNIEEGVSSQNSTDAFVADGGGGIDAYAGGDEIIYDDVTNDRWESITAGVPSGTSKEEVYVDGHYKRTAVGDAPYRCYGDRVEPNKNHYAKVKTAKGFTIGNLANLNVDGEQLAWLAIRA
jgi:hypothetical protein